jgi:thymidylate kinase
MSNEKKTERPQRREKYIQIEGPDGSGKGTAIRALIQEEQREGRWTFDSISFMRAESKGLPELEDFWKPPIRHYHTIIVEEPTYEGIGKTLREEIIVKNGRTYSAKAEMHAYSLNREVLMRRVIKPALENGVRVLSSRGVLSSLIYQSLRMQEENNMSLEKARSIIEKCEGNRLQLQYSPDLLIVQQLGSVEEQLKRLESRQKDDNCKFETADFQRRLNEQYQAPWVTDYFEKRGTKVVYLDSSRSEQETRNQAIDIYKKNILNKK